MHAGEYYVRVEYYVRGEWRGGEGGKGGGVYRSRRERRSPRPSIDGPDTRGQEKIVHKRIDAN